MNLPNLGKVLDGLASVLSGFWNLFNGGTDPVIYDRKVGGVWYRFYKHDRDQQKGIHGHSIDRKRKEEICPEEGIIRDATTDKIKRPINKKELSSLYEDLKKRSFI